jgi:GNAT superfamily N-acetyltransferase
MKTTVLRTTSDNPDFRSLVAELDQSLWERNKEAGPEYWSNNIIEYNANVVIVYQDEIAVGCGCFKKQAESTVELKRMYVAANARKFGFATMIITELEQWAKELNYTIVVLETLFKQIEAIGLYEKVGYEIIDNYPPYVGQENSICMSKEI